jgi:hypothetical protein
LVTLWLCVRPASARVGLGATSQTNRSVPIPPREDFARCMTSISCRLAMSAATDLTKSMCRRHPGPPITLAASDGQIVRSGSRCRASAPIAASARARRLSSSGSSHHGAPRSPKATLAACTPLPCEPHAIRITGTFRRADRTSSRHQLIHELFPKRRRNRGIGPPPASPVESAPPCVVVQTGALPTTGRSERIGCGAFPPSSKGPRRVVQG